MADVTFDPTAVVVLAGSWRSRIAGEALTRGDIAYPEADETGHITSKLADSSMGDNRVEVILSDAAEGATVLLAHSRNTIVETGAVLAAGQLYVVSGNSGKMMPYADLTNDQTLHCVGVGHTLASGALGLYQFVGTAPEGARGDPGTLYPTEVTANPGRGESLKNQMMGEAVSAGDCVYKPRDEYRWFLLSSNVLIDDVERMGDRFYIGLVAADAAAGDQVSVGYLGSFEIGVACEPGVIYCAGSTAGEIIPYEDFDPDTAESLFLLGGDSDIAPWAEDPTGGFLLSPYGFEIGNGGEDTIGGG